MAIWISQTMPVDSSRTLMSSSRQPPAEALAQRFFQRTYGTSQRAQKKTGKRGVRWRKIPKHACRAKGGRGYIKRTLAPRRVLVHKKSAARSGDAKHGQQQKRRA